MEAAELPTLDGLGPAVAQLELENAFLTHLLQRVSAASARTAAAGAAAAAAAAEIGREPLLLAERQELCAVEAGAVRREIEALKAAGELERSCAVAAAADCRTHQAAEVGRAVAALLGLLGFPQPDTATAAAMAAASAAAAAAGAAAEQPAAAGNAPEQPASTGSVCSPPSSPAPAAAARLPTAKQLARAQLEGRKIEQLLEELLERQDVAAERLRTRAAMLQAQLAQAEAQLAQRTEQGAAFSRVDFEQLRIEHSQASWSSPIPSLSPAPLCMQAETALAGATAEAISLKAAVAAAQQRLADQRAALNSAAAATAALKKEAGGRDGQLEVLRGEVSKTERERSLLERECARLRQQRGKGSGGGSGAAKAGGGSGTADAGAGLDGASAEQGRFSAATGQTIMDYMRLKQAMAEAQKATSEAGRGVGCLNDLARQACSMRPFILFSMRGLPPPQPSVRLVAAAAVGAAAGGAAGWSLAHWQQRRQQEQQPVVSIPTEEEAAHETKVRRQVDQLVDVMAALQTPVESPLHDAAVIDDVEGARKALAAAPDPREAALAKNTKGHTALLLAAVHGSDQVARLLLEAAPEAATLPCTDAGWLPVHAAAQEGYTDVLKLLLDTVPECAAGETAIGWTAATYATRHGHVAALQLLLSAAPQLASQKDGEGRTCAYHAAETGRLACLGQLLAACPDSAAAVQANGNITPAHTAAANGHAAALELILAAAPATATQQSALGSSPAHFAADEGHVACLHKVLAVAPEAAQKGHAGSLQRILKVAPQASHAQDLKGRTPFDLAKENFNIEAMTVLLTRRSSDK
ncbi:serine threonine- phosphatase 6 regulatory ankyrin repeat subunit C [Chlorella sorokiniana]|uniref:Serine threonine-phosphatase 6 regulatory ankyrin repeat subunit C n=1 Tax=Chlorella sorokiniana TaxID=3076 RepID=A0A2P6TLQ4_CHLSO|nr:serine threonine- phosphatase 6 regulatory ankyrin repeat subunit C [Chlorella sorokiniana]|eukprot:PRW45223.1 serine threonine- phosphatase 6 regulatory ankyrin repeat subunit C [Chlorella sorokiniana]